MTKFLTALCVLLCLSSKGQQNSFIQYSQADGLSQSQVRSMFLDSKGNMWIGTLGGMSKFNGEDFENFSKFTGMFDDHANVIKELEDKQIIVGSVGGISIMNAFGFNNYKFEQPYESTFVSDLCELSDGRILISTFNGVFILENEVIKLLDPEKTKRSYKILKLDSGEILVSSGNEIFEFDNDKLVPFFQGLERNSVIFDMVQDLDNSLLLATNNQGIIRLSSGKIEHRLTTIDGLSSNEVRSMLITKDGLLWAGTSKGASVVSTKGIRNFHEQNGLPSDDIRCIISDFNGNIWLGSEANGIVKFTSSFIVNYSTADELSSNLVMSIAKDGDNILVGTYDNGLSIIGNKKILKSDLNSGIDNLRIWDINKVDESRVLFATDDGLFIKYSDDTFKQLTNDDGLNSRKLKCIYTDQFNRIWIGGNNGVNIIEGDSLYSFDFPENLKITKTRSIIEDTDGTMWFGTRQGLISYNSNGFKYYGTEEGLMDESIYDLEIDHENRVWVATRNGLHYMDNDQIHLVKIARDSPSNHVNFIRYIPVNKGTIIAGTNNGIYTIDISSGNLADPQIFHIAIQHGLAGTEMNQNAIFVDEQNQIWVGSTKGLSKIESIEKLLKGNREIPKIYLKNVRLNLEYVNWNEYSDSVDRITGLPNNLKVNYEKNHFTFAYQGISYNDPENIRYQYKMDGADADWQPVTSDKIATYSNLDYKSFKFWVRCKVKNSDWSDPVSFEFSILPPFWRTWWFYILATILSAGTLYLIYYRRKKILFTQLEKEKFEFKSKMLALEQQSLNSSMNRHFIFNSLNSIQYYINRKDRLSANRYLSSFAKLIRKNLDSSQTNTTNLKDELDRLELYVELEQMRFKDKFEFQLNVQKEVDTNTVRVPSMLLQPFLENSIWHGLLPKDEIGKLEVNITQMNDNLTISIKDNGIGIQTSLKNKEGKLNHDSKGMSITKGRIDLIRKAAESSMDLIGPQEIKNEKGETIGTEVRIILPNNLEEIYPK